MANETDTGLMGQKITAEALIAQAAKPFDPASLLTAPPKPRRPLSDAEALPYAAGPTPEVVPTFDPATLLGDAARRGPAMIGDGRPLIARIGGVEVVTIPVEHYAALVSPLALLARQDVALDAAGMLDLLLSLHARQVVSAEQVAEASGLALADLAGRIALRAAALSEPETMPVEITPTPDAVTVDLTPTPEPAPVEVASTPKEATIDLGQPQENPIAIPPVPLDTRTVPPELEKSTTYGFRRREKHEKRGGPMDAKGQPDTRETDVHDTTPASTRKYGPT